MLVRDRNLAPATVSAFRAATVRERTFAKHRYLKGAALKAFSLCILLAMMLLAGCAPQALGPAVNYSVDTHHVRDASARRVADHWYLRFNALMISDLDDAIATGKQGNVAEMRRRAEMVLRAAESLAVSTIQGELDRLPNEARNQLRERVQPPVSEREKLDTVVEHAARTSLTELLDSMGTASDKEYVRKLTALRKDIEPAPDDQGRLLRQLTLGWAAVPAWLGVEKVDKDIESRRDAMAEATFSRTVVCLPHKGDRSDPLSVNAPILVIEWPEERAYPSDYDRIGEVYLTGDVKNVQVNINTSRPKVYTYTSEAKINGRRHQQLVYCWWFPHRPAMEANDPAAGHIDGDTLRITLDEHGQPAIFEVMQSCGCGHLIYVSQELEDLARRTFQVSPTGDELAVQRPDLPGHQLIVMGACKVPEPGPHARVFIMAGYHSVYRVDCGQGITADGLNAVDQFEYDLADYDNLDHLPLGDGVASMFGPDGLVHNAGRKEGWLLAPTGMLSAGQPRKRGTQKLRWDEYSFDDPQLLEKALHLPEEF